MGNAFGMRRQDYTLYVKLNNAMTDPFVVTLALSSAALARTPWQERVSLWIAKHDQSLHGIGTVGFSLDELPWESDLNFQHKKRFIRAFVEDAILGKRFSPFFRGTPQGIAWLEDALNAYWKIVVDFVPTFITEPRNDDRFALTESYPYERCSIHGIFLRTEPDRIGSLYCSPHREPRPHGQRCIACNCCY